MTNPSADEKVYFGEIQAVLREVLACLKTLALYPENHPAQRPSLERAFSGVEGLLADRDALIFGVAEKEIILVGEDEKESRIESDVAARLHQLGVLAAKFSKGLTLDELEVFLQLLSKTRESSKPRSERAEAMTQSLQEAGIRNINLSFVDYRQMIEQEGVGAIQERSTDLWTSLIKGVLSGDGKALKGMADAFSDCSQLESVTTHLVDYYRAQPKETLSGDEAELIAEIHQRLFDNFSLNQRAEFSKKMAEIVLTKDETSPESENKLSRAFVHYPNEMLLKVLASAVVQQGKTDNRMAPTLQVLLQDNKRRESLFKASEGYARKQDYAGYTADVWQQVGSLFLGGSEDQYMSDGYQQVLNDLSKFHLSELEQSVDRDYLLEVQSSLRPEVLCQTRKEIVFDLIHEETQEDVVEELPDELRGMLEGYVQNKELDRIIAALDRLLADPPENQSSSGRMEDVLFEFQGSSWIVQLIEEIGNLDQQEFILLKEILGYCREGLPGFLIQRLGVEKSISGRKRLSNILMERGAPAFPAILEGLRDDRWFLVRNLVMILGKIGDESCVEDLMPLLSHDHIRVSKEVLLTLSLIGGDRVVPQARRILLNRSRKTDTTLQTAAALALKRIGTPKALKVLKEGLEDRDRKVQEACCQVIKGLV